MQDESGFQTFMLFACGEKCGQYLDLVAAVHRGVKAKSNSFIDRCKLGLGIVSWVDNYSVILDSTEITTTQQCSCCYRGKKILGQLLLALVYCLNEMNDDGSAKAVRSYLHRHCRRFIRHMCLQLRRDVSYECTVAAW